MYDVNLKKVIKDNMFTIIVFIIFLVIFGIICYACFMIPSVINRYDSKVAAIKVIEETYINDENQTMYTPIYKYKVNGNFYSCRSNVSTNQKDSGEQKYVYYVSFNPADCMTDIEYFSNFVIFIPLAFVFCIVIVFGSRFKKSLKEIKRVNHLAKHGTLFKDLEYIMEPTSLYVNGIKMFIPTIDYTLPNGEKVRLQGEAKYSESSIEGMDRIDLLIDLEDPTNYYMDFNINMREL